MADGGERSTKKAQDIRRERTFRFADNLRQLRVEKGMSQQQLAAKMFVNRSSIARWESGSRLPDLLLIHRLAECLGVEVSALLPDSDAQGRTPVVILVDDEKPILTGELHVLSQTLTGAEITGFTRPSEAVEFARGNPVSLAFLDIEMGRTTGFDLCKELVEINPATNVVFLTAWPDHSLKAWDTAACGFLLKPLMPEDVLAVLSKLKHPIRGQVIEAEGEE